MPLHRVNLPTCVDQLNNILNFQRQVLTFICDPEIETPFTEDMFQEEFGETGVWLWGKLWKQDGTQSEFHRDLLSLHEYLAAIPDKQEQFLEMFDHDITFHENIDDETFRFFYCTTLTEQEQNVLYPVLKAFYEKFLSSGYPSTIHGDDNNFNRDRFIAEFWNNNPDLKVCPACDGQKPDKVDNKVYADADHYLPKSVYPILSVHVSNLIPLCLDCNRTFKGQRDPIDDQIEQPLVNCFFPYGHEAIDQIVVEIDRSQTGQQQISIIDNNGMPSRRVASLNRVFRLEARWLNRLEGQKDSIIEDIISLGQRDRRKGISQSPQDLIEDLNDRLVRKEENIGQNQNNVICSGYLRFALEDQAEFDTLFGQFMGV